MKTTIGKYFVLAALIGSLTACGNLSTRDRSTIAGAAIGGGAGAIMTGGSGWGTVGGAAVGGFIGNVVGK
ncbi:MAG: osmotically-inducible lipoprotein B [Alcaligenaceae bacterium]|jgi:osmotically inducible lipoprotein OsmB|nr:osmotically-inducible lipoprotein B [Alcaligenaceae bacterium]